MPSLGGLVATLAAISWALVYAFTQDILELMSPVNLLSATYLLAGILSLLPFAIFGDFQNVRDGLNHNPLEFVFYVFMLLLAKYFMIYSVKLIGATAAGLVEISYPIWTAVILYVWKGEKPDLGTVVGGSFILLGVIIIVATRSSDNVARHPHYNSEQLLSSKTKYDSIN